VLDSTDCVIAVHTVLQLVLCTLTL